ncbi:MAG TPA: hypothetical protein PLR74_06105 [Agriterribacter sp.]|nr:hypothetical protein [Agriterribacter sp.]
MNRISSNIPQKFLRYFFVLAAVVLVLLSSCRVKSGIKTLIGVPATTEQGIAKGNHNVYSNNQERCINSETAEMIISPITSVDVNHLLPAVLFTVAFFFLPGITRNKQSHPFYRSSNIPGAIPIFLQYRKLII